MPVTRALRYILKYFKELSTEPIGGLLILKVVNAIRSLPPLSGGDDLRYMLALQVVYLCFVEGELTYLKDASSSADGSDNDDCRGGYSDLIEQGGRLFYSLWSISNTPCFLAEIMIKSLRLTCCLWEPRLTEQYPIELDNLNPIDEECGLQYLLNNLLLINLISLVSHVSPRTFENGQSRIISDQLHAVLYGYSTIVERLFLSEFVTLSTLNFMSLVS